MAYKVLSLEDLQKLAAWLESKYKNKNPDRLNFIKFIKKLVADPELASSPDAARILTGAYIFMMRHIRSTYKIRSELNSTLCDLINQGLKNTPENVLSNEAMLIYLTDFYKYMQDRAPTDLLENTTWGTNQILTGLAKNELYGLFCDLSPQISFLLSRHPASRSVLFHNLDKMELAYMKKGSKGGLFSTAYKHRPLAKFIDLVVAYCNEFQPKGDDKNKDTSWQYDPSFMLPMGATAFAMRSIDDEYKWTDPYYNCEMYVMCGTAINAKYTKDINIEDRIAWFNLLAKHIDNMREHKEFLLKHQNAGYQNIDAELVTIQRALRTYHATYVLEQNAVSPIEKNVALATSNVAQIGIMSGIRNTAGNIIPSPAVVMINAATGIAGFFIAGPAGAAVAVPLMTLVRTHLVPLAVAVLFAGFLDKIGNRIGYLATGAAKMPFSLTISGFKSLVDWYRHVEFDKNELLKNEELLTALANYPDDIFSIENKTTLELTQGTAPAMGVR